MKPLRYLISKLPVKLRLKLEIHVIVTFQKKSSIIISIVILQI